MQAVIMAAGKGTRMGNLVKDRPKHLLDVAGEPILRHTISVLPEEIDSVILVIGYLGEMVMKIVGNRIGELPIKYVVQKELLGTANALWLVRSFLDGDRFLVMGGDDWYEGDDLKRCVKENLAFGVHRIDRPTLAAVKIRAGGFLDGLMDVTEETVAFPVYKATGVYVLDHKIFNYKPVDIKGGETGLPQTVIQMAKDHDIKIVEMPGWRQVNTPEELEELRGSIEG